MPSFIGTPAQLAWVGGVIGIEPVRQGYDAASQSWVGGSVLMGPNLTTGLTVKKPRLDRLQRGQGYYNNIGIPTVQMQSLWQKNVESVEGSFEQLINQVNGIQAALDAAQAAQETAAAAGQTAQAVSDEVALANSSTVPVDGNITASSDGVITIAAHSRKYSATNIVSVDAGFIAGCTQGVFYRIYYNDAARQGGPVVYMATSDEIAQSGVVHVVGGVTIPQDGEPPASGGGTSPPGYVRAPIDRGGTE